MKHLLAFCLLAGVAAYTAPSRAGETLSPTDLAQIRAAMTAQAAAQSVPVKQQAYAKASNPSTNDWFGESIAISGNTVVVGAPLEDSNALGLDEPTSSGSGAAYVFVRNGSTWSQQAMLKAGNLGQSDTFGTAVAISGNTIVVGAPDEDGGSPGVNGPSNNDESDSGAAYVFVRTGTTWTQDAYLKASDPSDLDGFGSSVAIDGDTIVVGSPEEDSNAVGVNGEQNNTGKPGSGAAYVFQRSGGVWAQEAYLKSSNSDSGDNFGHDVAIDGDTVAISSRAEDSGFVDAPSDNSALAAGAVYVFTRSTGIWSQQAYLKASNPGGDPTIGAYGDNFGFSLDLSGNTLVVGAPQEDSAAVGVNPPPGTDPSEIANFGAAYVFTRSGSVWAQEAYLKASNPGVGDQFGWSVAVDGNVVVVGAHAEDGAGKGANPPPSEGIGNSGAAYLFRKSDGTWAQIAYLKASNPGTDDYFGENVAIDNSTLAVAAAFESNSNPGIDPPDNDLMTSSGAAYFFAVPGIPVSSIEVSQTLVRTDTPAVLTATFQGEGPFTFQWFKGKQEIPGATSNPLVIDPVSLNDAGLYRVRVTSNANSATSSAVQLAVVDAADRIVPTKDGGTLLLDAPARGTGLSFQWFRNGDQLDKGDLGGRVAGATTARLKITRFSEADEADFTCRVTLGAQSVFSGAQQVRIRNAPDIAPPAVLPTWITSGTVDLPITDLFTLLNPAEENRPTRYVVTGLPRGLRYDSVAQRIVGKPQVSGLTSIVIRILVENEAGGERITLTLPFESLPARMVGPFRGLVNLHPIVNDLRGGAIELNVTDFGRVTGKLRMGKEIRSFAGQLDATAGSPDATTLLTIPRRGLSPLRLGLSFAGNAGTFQGELADNPHVAPCSGVRSPWTTRKPAQPATAYAGAYTAGLPFQSSQDPDPDGDIQNYPQGIGHLIAKVQTNGVVKGTARLSDGATVSFATLLGEGGQIPLYLPAYGNDGGAQGWSQIDSSSRDWDGSLVARKDTEGTRTVPREVSAHALDVVGGVWEKPAALVLGLTDDGTTANLQCGFTFAGIGSASIANGGQYAPSVRVTAPNHAIALPNPNPGRLKLNIDPTTGEFRGEFRTVDANPLSPSKDVERIAPFSGVFVPRLEKAVGTFSLPMLPSAEEPNARKTSILSGRVELVPVP